MPDYDTVAAVEGGRLTVTAMRVRSFVDLSGDETEVPEEVAAVEIDADADLALAIGQELEAWYADQQDAGPPDDGKPVHQQYAEAEPDAGGRPHDGGHPLS